MLADFLRPADVCFTIQEEIAPKINLDGFEDMYKDGGRATYVPQGPYACIDLAVFGTTFG